MDKTYRQIRDFEHCLGELVGQPVSLDRLDPAAIETAEKEIISLASTDRTTDQTFDTFRSLLIYFDVHPVSRAFFERYFTADSFRTTERFLTSVRRYQKDAIRLYSTFRSAYLALATSDDIDTLLAPLRARNDEPYRTRTEWDRIAEIPEERLPDLGYIAAELVRKEHAERTAIHGFLRDLASRIREHGHKGLQQVGDRKRREMDSLLRKFDPGSTHSLFSPLFLPDPDELERKADQIGPKGEGDLARMEGTQSLARQNLAQYLAADHLDVYVATSMRTDADFVSVNRFVQALFRHDDVRPLKLRYFNPTQSWIGDRVAKGLVEALMLRRSQLTIYMAQKEDTFGKDSEASVALGQGKPVIVYVPKLVIPELGLDTETLGKINREQLRAQILREATDEEEDFDETMDTEALVGRLLSVRLGAASGGVLANAVRRHWADFDLYGEAKRIEAPDDRAQYRLWLDSVVRGDAPAESPVDPPVEVRDHVVSILVATSLRFERRARIFREVHPLALQVILSSGVLNGILVARSVDACAAVIRALVKNDLDLEMVSPEDEAELNYRLVERTTGSTIRVISRHQLLRNAFSSLSD
ncbi:MAG: hypothetical protein OXH09_10800 [Gammaproteobacteria bacterium]|nr:hypothetical protein [Gammaproteobacteria bacterium]